MIWLFWSCLKQESIMKSSGLAGKDGATPHLTLQLCSSRTVPHHRGSLEKLPGPSRMTMLGQVSWSLLRIPRNTPWMPWELSLAGRGAPLAEAVTWIQALKILLLNALCLPPQNGQCYYKPQTPLAILRWKMENPMLFQWLFSKLMPTATANAIHGRVFFKWNDQNRQ